MSCLVKTARRLRGWLETKATRGQAALELQMVLGLVVAMVIVVNRLFVPVVLDAFEQIAKAMSSVGP